MSGGVQSFFASLSPDTQNELISAASQALGAQHRSIGKNTAGASRVRQHLSDNDAYAQEMMQRAGMKQQMPHEATSDNSGVGDFQRQNDAFMALMGDDLVPPPAPSRQAPAKSAKPRPSGGTRYPLAEDPVNPDARPANLAQDEATSPYNRDRDAQVSQGNTQEAASGSGEADNFDAMPYILSVLGLRAAQKGVQAAGGRTSASVPANTTPDGGKEVGMARTPRDNIIDAEWSDHVEPKQITQEQRKLPGPTREAAARLTRTGEADEFDDVQKVLAEMLGRPEPSRTNFEKSKVPEGDTNPNERSVPKGGARADNAGSADNVTKAVDKALGSGNKANVIRGRTKVPGH